MILVVPSQLGYSVLFVILNSRAGLRTDAELQEQGSSSGRRSPRCPVPGLPLPAAAALWLCRRCATPGTVRSSQGFAFPRGCSLLNSRKTIPTNKHSHQPFQFTKESCSKRVFFFSQIALEGESMVFIALSPFLVQSVVQWPGTEVEKQKQQKTTSDTRNQKKTYVSYLQSLRAVHGALQAKN